MSHKKHLHGLRALVADVVEHGSTAIESVHKTITGRTFAVLESVAPLAAPTRVVHALHDASLTGVYGAIRVVNRAVSKGLELVIDHTHDE